MADNWPLRFSPLVLICVNLSNLRIEFHAITTDPKYRIPD
jgi:hypothetical protein